MPHIERAQEARHASRMAKSRILPSSGISTILQAVPYPTPPADEHPPVPGSLAATHGSRLPGTSSYCACPAKAVCPGRPRGLVSLGASSTRFLLAAGLAILLIILAVASLLTPWYSVLKHDGTDYSSSGYWYDQANFEFGFFGINMVNSNAEYDDYTGQYSDRTGSTLDLVVNQEPPGLQAGG